MELTEQVTSLDNSPEHLWVEAVTRHINHLDYGYTICFKCGEPYSGKMARRPCFGQLEHYTIRRWWHKLRRLIGES